MWLPTWCEKIFSEAMPASPVDRMDIMLGNAPREQSHQEI
jgi:hypothetical protein